MNNELTNLLPQERQRMLSRDYFFRLGVAAAVLTTVLTVAAGLLLVPTYVFLVQNATTKQNHLSNIESLLSSSNEAALSARLAALSTDASVLTALRDAPSVTATVRSVLAVPRPRVSLSSFSYAPGGSGASGALSIAGVAATRDSLRAYQLALQNDPLITAANLPVSAYAKDTDISFTISVTLAP